MTSPVVLTVQSPLLGMLFSSLLYGVLLMQTAVYTQRFPNDRPILKVVVAILCILETAQFVLSIVMIEYYLITNYDVPQALNHIPKVFAVSLALGYATGCVVNWCFSWRIYILSERLWIGCILAFLSAGRAAFAMRNCFLTLKYDSWDVYRPHAYRAFLAASSLNLLVDTIIAATTSYFLYTRKTGWKSTDSLVRRLLFYTFNTGAAVFLLSLMVIITFTTVQADAFLAFVQVQSEVFCISVMTTLIGRKRTVDASGRMTHTFDSPEDSMRFRSGNTLSTIDQLQGQYQMHPIIAITSDHQSVFASQDPFSERKAETSLSPDQRTITDV